MEISILAISILSGVLVMLIITYIYVVTRKDRISIEGRLGSGDSVISRKYTLSESKFASFYNRSLKKSFPEHSVEKASGFFGVSLESLQDKIESVGMQDKISAVEIVLLKVIGIAVAAAGIIATAATANLFVAVPFFFIFLACFMLPQDKIEDRIKENRDEIERMLPRFIEQVYLCTESGAGLEDSLKLVAQNTGGVLGESFRKVFLNAGYTGSWDDEAVKMAKESKVEALEDFVSNIVIAYRKGVDISDILREEAKHINQINKSRVMARITRLKTSLSPLQIFFCMIPMMALVLLPVMIQLLESM